VDAWGSFGEEVAALFGCPFDPGDEYGVFVVLEAVQA
jgi:hypothetical protein